MNVTLTLEDVDTVVDQGTVVVITGTGEDRSRVTFGMDHRPAAAILEALVTDQEDEIDVEVEDWQVLGVDAYEPVHPSDPDPKRPGYTMDGSSDPLGSRQKVCKHCGQETYREPGVGLVSTLSGDLGGTYDICPDSDNQKHERA